MIVADRSYSELINSPVRSIGAKVELFNSSTLVKTFNHTDSLKSFTIDRVGEDSKFFGFGVCQKLNVKLIDMQRQIAITTANTFKVFLGSGYNYLNFCPLYKVSEVHRDETTNELSITAYDALYQAANFQVKDLNIKPPYTIKQFADACGSILGLTEVVGADKAFDLSYDSGANFEGSESVREALNAIAEATQTIYYINHLQQLVFKRLDVSGNPVAAITKDKYFSLDSGTNRKLAKICHATELGDNVSAESSFTGSTQYVRDNAFWELRDDIGQLVNDALAAVGGMTINQFACSWRGDFLAEIGDKISLTTRDNKQVISYLLNDVISYDGTLSQETQWKYEDNDNESEDNPSSIGDALKQTFAKVDKANKKIDLVVSDVKSNKEALAQLQLTTDKISGSVSSLQTNLDNAIGGVSEDITEIKKKVEATMTSEEVNIAIKKELENGVDKVQTTTGFTFNEDGLNVSKSGSEMETKITEDGMIVSKNNTNVLIANNEGVKAEDLHATTYLIIGNNSRFEDYGTDRTGCFWIGG